MGIPSYFVYLIKNYKNLITDTTTITTIDNLYIDSNSIIYDVINNDIINNTNVIVDNIEITNKLIIKKTIDKINSIISEIKPQNRVIIAFDGIPPISKIYQQRKRRFLGSIENKYLDKHKKYDTCNITPGTKFMDLLNTTINKKDCFKYNGTIYISGSDIPQEGEHKIFKYIRDNIEYHKTTNTVIYGIDADLFMLSLSHLKYCQAIFLYRETPVFIKSLDIGLIPEKRYVINIEELGKKIASKMQDNIDDLSNVIDNYVFICMLLGNDFLPHFASINIRDNGITTLIELFYRLFNKSRYSIINDGNIIWKNLKLFVKELANIETDKLQDVFKQRSYHENRYRKKYNNNIIVNDENYNDIPVWERNIEHFINVNESSWEMRYYYSLFNINISEYNKYKKEVDGICNNYLTTLQWNYIYYTCDCPDYNHYYKYNYAPLLQDLYKAIPLFDIDLIEPIERPIISVYSLLAFVLPHDKHYLLNGKVKRLVDKKYNYYYNENNYNIMYAFCKYTWEAAITFNQDIDIDKLDNDIKYLSC